MKKTKLPSIVAILILTLITAVMWVSFNIIRAVTTKPAPSVPEAVSKPLDPTLNQKTISLIQGKVYIEDANIPQVISFDVAPEPTSEPIDTPVPSETLAPTTTTNPTGTEGPVSISVDSVVTDTALPEFVDPIDETI